MPAPKERRLVRSKGRASPLKKSTRHILTAARKNRLLSPAHRDALAAALLEVRRAGGRIGVRKHPYRYGWSTWAWSR